MDADLDAAIDDLYALPPSEFTAARNALVKRLKAEKRRDDAEAVKQLRRPTVPAWAVNQLHRTDPSALDRLFQAGAAVATAQRRALSGVRDAGLREASAQRRESIDEAWKVVAQILRDAGIDPVPHRPPVAATLEAASADPAVGEGVRAGRLAADLPAPSGFGDVFGFSVVPDAGEERGGGAAGGGSPAAGDGAAQARRRARLEQQLAAATSEATAAARRARELTDRAADQRRAAARAEAEATRLEQRAAAARAAASEQTAAAQEAVEEADSAARAADAAAGDLERLRAALDGG